MADYLHEEMTGAWQDRSRVRTISVAAAIWSLKFVSRKAKVEPLLAILDTPLIARYIAGAALPRPRREALPLPFEVLVQWERWICSGSAPEPEILFIGSIRSWRGQASASQTRSAQVPLHCIQTDMLYGKSAGEPKSPDLASHLVLLPLVFLDDLQAGVGATRVLQCASQLALPDGVAWGPNATQEFLQRVNDYLVLQ